MFTHRYNIRKTVIVRADDRRENWYTAPDD